MRFNPILTLLRSSEGQRGYIGSQKFSIRCEGHLVMLYIYYSF